MGGAASLEPRVPTGVNPGGEERPRRTHAGGVRRTRGWTAHPVRRFEIRRTVGRRTRLFSLFSRQGGWGGREKRAGVMRVLGGEGQAGVADFPRLVTRASL